MKHKLALFGMVGLASLVLTSFSSDLKIGEKQEPKKPRHIKMTKIENGKKMELDTVVTGDEVFIWNGDTIGGNELGKHLSPSGFDKMKHVEVFVDGDEGGENVMIYRNKDRKGGKHIIRHLDSGEDMEIFNEESGDSLQKRIIIRKRMNDGDEDQMIFINEPNMEHFPPMPPVPPIPPMPHMKMLNGQHSGRIIDLNDPNIISYKKKELSGDREKIEIIRKKSEETENMTFDFKFDNELMAPEAPESIREFEGDNQKMKIMEKEIKVDGKKGKEIKVKVESEDNK